MTLPVIIMGGGGHAKVLIAALKLLNIDILGVIDIDPKMRGARILGIEVVGDEKALTEYPAERVLLVNAIGSVRQPEQRSQLYKKYKDRGYLFAGVVHPSCIISESVEIGEGAQVMAGSIIQPGCSIGENSIINTGVSIDHDCHIGKHVHLAPGVVLSGNVFIGDETHIGTAGTVIQNVKIGERCLIGAGSLVLKKIPSDTVAYGVPAEVVL